MLESAPRLFVNERDCKPQAHGLQEKSEPQGNFFLVKVNLSEIWLRIQEAFDSQNAAEIARKLNIERQSVYKWRDGKNAPDLERLVEISTVTGSSLHWLVTGQGSREVNATQVESQASKGGALLEQTTIAEIFTNLYNRLETLEAELASLKNEPASYPNVPVVDLTATQIPIPKQIDNIQIVDLINERTGLGLTVQHIRWYREYKRIGDKKFSTLSQRTQEIITAYFENRLDDYLQARKEGTG